MAASLVFGAGVATLPFRPGALVGLAGFCGRPSLETVLERSFLATFGLSSSKFKLAIDPVVFCD